MALSYDTWQTDLEDAIKAHIIDTLKGEHQDVLVYIGRELERPFPKPIITLGDVGGDRENTGGMNVVSETEQGHWYMVDLFLTVNTDDGTGQQIRNNKIWSLLNTVTFGQQLHSLKSDIDAITVTLENRGLAHGDPTNPPVWFQRQAMLSCQVLVAFISVVI